MTMTPEQAKGLAGMFAGMLEREMGCTRRVLAAMPDDKLEFKLGDKGRTAHEIMWHIAAGEEWFAESILRGDFDAPESQEPAPATTAALVAWYDARLPALLEKVKGLAGERLAAPVSFFAMPPMPMVMYLEFWKVHTIHHRGQLSSYLRAVNARVPDIYGGSADEPYQAPASA